MNKLTDRIYRAGRTGDVWMHTHWSIIAQRWKKCNTIDARNSDRIVWYKNTGTMKENAQVSDSAYQWHYQSSRKRDDLLTCIAQQSLSSLSLQCPFCVTTHWCAGSFLYLFAYSSLSFYLAVLSSPSLSAKAADLTLLFVSTHSFHSISDYRSAVNNRDT